jgi:protein SCO1/2
MPVHSNRIAAVSSVLLTLALLAGAGVPAGEREQHQHVTATGQADVDPHAHHRAQLAGAGAGEGVSASVQLHDRTLLDQDGEPVRFATDVIGDRIVVMDFVYTTCTTVCPVLSAVFGQVQNRLGERLGDEVRLVSVSVDPGRDTPQRLKAYAARHNARPGWVWLTGDKTAVDEVLHGMGAYTPEFEDHPSMVLVGDGHSGTWTRFFGFPGPDQLLAAVAALETSRQAATPRQSRQE